MHLKGRRQTYQFLKHKQVTPRLPLSVESISLCWLLGTSVVKMGLCEQLFKLACKSKSPQMAEIYALGNNFILPVMPEIEVQGMEKAKLVGQEDVSLLFLLHHRSRECSSPEFIRGRKPCGSFGATGGIKKCLKDSACLLNA